MALGGTREFFYSRRYMERATMLRICGSAKNVQNLNHKPLTTIFQDVSGLQSGRRIGASWYRSRQWRLVPCASLRGCFANAAPARESKDSIEIWSLIVGAPGIEPGTSCTPCKRASRTAPRPAWQASGAHAPDTTNGGWSPTLRSGDASQKPPWQGGIIVAIGISGNERALGRCGFHKFLKRGICG
jgi:hypothetical protein